MMQPIVLYQQEEVRMVDGVAANNVGVSVSVDTLVLLLGSDETICTKCTMWKRFNAHTVS